ncbi:prominin family protein [Planomonospora venezuelensis]|uniref:Tfp pilus assembly protein PilX n=1 Tax=Planomonospora venezuelensis TaxID=1999 RepID=A0A841DCS2_PLAVE|nr:prominin family protein [Planomonospora venezuelensis]MBB5967921.1 Tfp pilus assembly protein PilX [Planomonospora venezuelensis]
MLAMAAELSFLVFWLFGMLVLFFIIYSAVRLALKHDRRSRGR